MARFRAPCRSVAVATLLSLIGPAALADDPHAERRDRAPASSATATTPAPTPAQAPSSSAYAPAPRETTSPTPSGTTAATAMTENPSPDTAASSSAPTAASASRATATAGRGATPTSSRTAPRIDEDSYAELELRREDTLRPQPHEKVVATLGFFPPFFHFSGNETHAIAVRNLYAQATYGD